MSIVTYTYRPEDRATGGPNGPINVIVLHTLECPTGLSANGEGYARMLTGPNYLGQRNMEQIKSVHYVVGVQDICASCPEDTLAWHARGASKGCIAIEQEGRAAFTQADWASGDGAVIVRNTASLVGDIHQRHGIPLRFLSGDALRTAYADHSDLAAGGVTTHHELTRAGIGGNDHTDPGDAYPIDLVLQLADGAGPAESNDTYVIRYVSEPSYG